MQNEIKTYPKNLRVFNGRGGQEIVDNFLIGCRGIVPALDSADKFIKIYKHFQKKDILKANEQYKKILPATVFIMQSINTMICYGKRICAYRMGIKKVYDRSPIITPSDFGIYLAKYHAKNLGKF